jgi:hypothetical protein
MGDPPLPESNMAATGGGGFAYSVPRGKRFDDKQNVADDLVLWRALDPNQKWSATAYNPQAAVNAVHLADIRKEELSTAVSDRTTLVDLKSKRFPGWKVAEFTVREARACGYWAMRDPNESEDVVLYDGADPNKLASKPVSKKLTRLARLV